MNRINIAAKENYLKESASIESVSELVSYSSYIRETASKAAKGAMHPSEQLQRQELIETIYDYTEQLPHMIEEGTVFRSSPAIFPLVYSLEDRIDADAIDTDAIIEGYYIGTIAVECYESYTRFSSLDSKGNRKMFPKQVVYNWMFQYPRKRSSVMSLEEAEEYLQYINSLE